MCRQHCFYIDFGTCTWYLPPPSARSKTKHGMNLRTRPWTILLPVAFLVAPATAQTSNNSRLYDPGTGMTAPAPAVATETSRLSFMIGDWDVQLTTFPTDSTTAVRRCVSSVTYMNRGHGIMERLHCASADTDEDPLDMMRLFAYSAGIGKWTLGVVDGYAESISVLDGGFDGVDLVLRNAVRVGGSANVTYYRLSTSAESEGAPVSNLDVSTDHGATWQPSQKMAYSARPEPHVALATADGFGAPADDLPDEARQFDFLIGEWTASHEMTFPNGQTAQWQANATGVYALGGRAVMEFNWFNTDPNLPDAATTIVRIYNRAMRRWESLYVTNRFNTMLFFGGVMDGDRIVLHPFEVNTAAPTISRWVFYNMSENAYDWSASVSRDRGASYTTTWKIQLTRKQKTG